MTAFTDSQLRDIQGIGIAGFKKDHSHFIFVRFQDQLGGVRFVSQVAPFVASAWEVGRFNDVFSEIRHRTREELLEATWVGLAISSSGYAKLGVNLDAELPPAEGYSAFK